MKLEYQFSLPASTVQYIATEVKKMYELSQIKLHSNILQDLLVENVSAEIIEQTCLEKFEKDSFRQYMTV